MAKNAAPFDLPKSHRVTLDPFNGILGIFFAALAFILPAAMPAADGRLNVLHFIGIAVTSLLSAFFFGRWFRAQLAHALRNETEENVVHVRITTFAQNAQANPPPTPAKSPKT